MRHTGGGGHSEREVGRTLYEIVGEDGFERLTRAFYAQVPEDGLLGPMYPEGQLEEARIRLRDFLVGRFGGPQRYIRERGHPRLRMRHMPFPIDTAARNRWMRLMTNALAKAELPDEAAKALLAFFAEVATFLVNRP